MASPPTHRPGPRLSVVVVADYAAEVDPFAATLAALEAEPERAQVELIAVDPPSELPPAVRVVRAGGGSYAQKNAGAAVASAPWIALLDADCRPARGFLGAWLALIAALPQAAVISGRTRYPGRSRLERCLGAIDRGYLDRGRRARTRHISNNNALYRAEVLRAHPLPTDLGAFASAVQADAIARAGGELWFDPSPTVIHGFEGWAMERDLRRQLGHATVALRRRHPELPHSAWMRLGRASIPVFVTARTVLGTQRAMRARGFELDLIDRALIPLVAPIVYGLEVPGMWAAWTEGDRGPSAYR